MKALALAAAMSLGAVPTSTQNVSPAFANLAFHQHPGAQLPLDAALRDEAGRPVTLGTALGGRPAIVVLEYLHCANLCGLVLAHAMAAIRDAGLVPGRDTELVAISIDPRDTSGDAAAARAMYSRAFLDPNAAAAGLHFLTGEFGQVGRIASAIGFPYRYDRASGQFAHPAGFVVTTADGQISRYVLGLDPSASQLREAVAQARLDRIAPPAHPLLCLCLGYDPDDATAAALVMKIVRIGALLTALALAGLVWLLSRRRTA